APTTRANNLETTQAHSTGRFISSSDAFVAGESTSFALYIKLEPAWHTYWHNPGDSAAAPILEVRAPKDYKVSAIRYPLPQRIPVGHLTSFGYANEVILGFDIQVPSEEASHLDSNRTVTLSAEWLVCQEECIPAFFDFE